MNTSQWTRMARQCLSLVDDLESQVTPHISTIPIKDIVSIGQRLWWIVKRADRMLDKIKVRLRTEAGAETGSKRFEGTDGAHCIVLVQPPSIVLRKDADIGALKSALGSSFNEVFEESVSYNPRRDFKDVVATLDPKVAQVVMGSVQLVDRTARVGFKD